MEPLPVEVHSAAAVRAMDRRAIEREGIAGYTLMQRAGAAALEVARRHWPAAARIAVLCGAGNNAGDGYVLARLAREAGMAVQVFALADPARLTGDAAQAFADFAAAGGQHWAFAPAAALERVELVVDAMLGTGVDRPVEGAWLVAIEAVNRSGLAVLALDVPSGLDADTGMPQGAAIRAARTITFVGLKSGLYLGAGLEHVGAIDFAGLGVSAETREGFAPALRRTTETLLAEALPPRRPASHKGDHGKVLVVGGFAMPGAAALAGEAALRTGAGLVTVATSASSRDAVVCARPELIVHAAAPTEMAAHAAAASATAIGPGLGLGDAAREAMGAALEGRGPFVIDADALTLLSREPRRRADWILTPHPGEAARLLGTDTAGVQRDRLAAVRAIAERYGGVCVLKGAGTLVQAPGEVPWICDRGTSAMATAGSGDVLTGILAALLAGGSEPGIAAGAGVLLHALAGERAAQGGTRGIIAGDLVTQLRALAGSPWR